MLDHRMMAPYVANHATGTSKAIERARTYRRRQDDPGYSFGIAGMKRDDLRLPTPFPFSLFLLRYITLCRLRAQVCRWPAISFALPRQCASRPFPPRLQPPERRQVSIATDARDTAPAQ